MTPLVENWRALGTSATVAVTDAGVLAPARAAVQSVLADLDAACSRFRADSELARVNRAAGSPVPAGPVLIETLGAALDAARATGGLVDPTVGAAMEAIGYDRDIAEVPPDGPPIAPVRAGDWRAVIVDPRRGTVAVPAGVQLDLGATAKAWAADVAAAHAAAAGGAGVLVNLGGDVAVAGEAPAGGWAIGVADDHAARASHTTVAIAAGGLATSSTTVRRWRRGGRPVHHIVDPATGLPAREVWRTVTVAAASCVDANVASTAAILRGESAPEWLAGLRLPARLVAAGGQVVTVGDWPAEELAA